MDNYRFRRILPGATMYRHVYMIIYRQYWTFVYGSTIVYYNMCAFNDKQCSLFLSVVLLWEKQIAAANLCKDLCVSLWFGHGSGVAQCRIDRNYVI